MVRLLLSDTSCTSVIMAGRTEQDCWQLLGYPSSSEGLAKLEITTFPTVFRRNTNLSVSGRPINSMPPPRNVDPVNSLKFSSSLCPFYLALAYPRRPKFPIDWNLVNSTEPIRTSPSPSRPRPQFYDEIFDSSKSGRKPPESHITSIFKPETLRIVDSSFHETGAEVPENPWEHQELLRCAPISTSSELQTFRELTRADSRDASGRTGLRWGDLQRGVAMSMIRRDPSLQDSAMPNMDSRAKDPNTEGFSPVNERPINDKFSHPPKKEGVECVSIDISRSLGHVRSFIEGALAPKGGTLPNHTKFKSDPVGQSRSSRPESWSSTWTTKILFEAKSLSGMAPTRHTLKREREYPYLIPSKAKKNPSVKSLDFSSKTSSSGTEENDTTNSEAPNSIYNQNRQANLKAIKEAEARQQARGDFEPPGQSAFLGKYEAWRQKVGLSSSQTTTLPIKSSTSGQSQALQYQAARYIPRDIQGRRLDLPVQFSALMVDRLEAQRLCNNYHLKGHCAYPKCKHLHLWHGRELFDEEKQALRVIARRSPCRAKNGCMDPECYAGHRCPNHIVKGNRICCFDECLHFEDSEPVNRPEDRMDES